MNRRQLLSAALGALTSQPRYIDGVFVHSGEAPFELLAFAEHSSTGQLRLASASFDDVPAVERVYRVLCSLPGWTPAAVWASTRAIFRNEYAERRQLSFAVRRISVYTVELRVADVETPEGAARLIRAIRGTADNPAYLFVTLHNSGVTREYMIELIQGS